MLLKPETTPRVRLLRYQPNGKFPAGELSRVLQDLLTQGTLNRVAILVDDEDAIEVLRKFDLQWLAPEMDYQWSGRKVQNKSRRPPKRVIAGSYSDWFRWFMQSQRFRAFHALILIEPTEAVSQLHGGYIDGMLAKLMLKGRQMIVVSKPAGTVPASDERRTKEVLRALLYGTRLSRPNLLEVSHFTFADIPAKILEDALKPMNLRLNREQTRYKLDSYNAELVEGAFPGAPFELRRRFRQEAAIPDEVLAPHMLRDVENSGWVTVPGESDSLRTWLHGLNERGDQRLRDILESMEDASAEQWDALLAPTHNQVRRVLDRLHREGKLERMTWYQEAGRPAFAYATPGNPPFLESRCGQCAFYAPAKRRCNLWWLANKTRPFFHEGWKPGGTVTDFEIHKMKFASKIGPHSSACTRFVDKKRDHLRDAIPEQCEICGESVPKSDGKVVTCRNCKTRYIQLTERVRVMTAYEHEYNRLYRQITGGDARTDLEAWRAKVKEDLRDRQKMLGLVDELDDILGEERVEYAPRIAKKWAAYSPALQESIDQLAKTTDIARRLSMAMAQSALNSTRRILEFGRVYSGEATPLIGRQGKYVDLIAEVAQTKLLPYEALIMKQYWAAYGLALRGVQQWFGPRKRSRYVTEFVGGLGGRAKGYSPLDAAINYLHQRRLDLAERINDEVGFSGTCNGFLHREQYDSRKIGLLLDMIDPFKFADREELLLLVLDQGLTWRDFMIETDRRGSSFYYPQAAALPKLDQLGSDADNRVMRYTGIDASLIDGYRRFADSLLDALRAHNLAKFEPFVFNPI